MWRKLWLRVWTPILDQLKQGLTPSQAALAISLGAYISVIPLLGTSALLCAIVAAALSLNHPVSQLANWLFFPLQVALLLPFYELGAVVFGGPHMTLSLNELLQRMGADPLGVVREFWWIGMHGAAVWLLLGLLVVPLSWFVLRALFKGVVASLYGGNS